MTYCARGVAVKPHETEIEATQHRCKCWHCEQCAPINRAQVIQAAIDGKPKALLTLTVSSAHTPDQSEAASALKRGLRLLRLRLRRHPRLMDFEFLAVFEAHKSGHPHLHLLVRGGFIPWRWLRMAWSEITGSTHVDIRKIKGRRDAARYVAKYIGKDLHAFPGCKRWWRSHGYALPQQSNDDGTRAQAPWCHLTMAIPQLRAVLEDAGWTIESGRSRALRARAPPDDPRTWLQHVHAEQRREIEAMRMHSR